jgi:phosphohistidine swiveling domain-containing protein
MTETMTEGWTLVGSGMATNFADGAEGTLREVRGPEDVLALTDEIDGRAWSPPVILVHEAGGTTLGPLLGEIAGVVSTKGTLGAHVALLAKEYGCPCIVGARLTVPADELGLVRLSPDGTVWAFDDIGGEASPPQ